MRVLYRRAAAEDIAQARAWYEGHRPGLGVLFEKAVHAIEQVVAAHPQVFPQVYRHLRRALVPRFPYAVYYRESEDGNVEIVACLHNRRNPEAWRSRGGDA